MFCQICNCLFRSKHLTNYWDLVEQVQPEGRRWGLTGTPIQNKPEDMFAYLNFLRHPLYEKHDAFKRDFTFSSNRSLRVALQQLRDVVRPLLLRRSKSSTIDGKPILELPRK